MPPADLTQLLRLAAQLSGQPPAQHADTAAQWARLPAATRQQHLATLAALADALAAAPGASHSTTTASSNTTSNTGNDGSSSSTGGAPQRDPIQEWRVLNTLLEELYRADEDVPQTLPAPPRAAHVPRIGAELRAYLGETCAEWERYVAGASGV
ncbi:hypothetical protein PsYK624_041990 [Phanerochaete sordida]|uniref:Uncharacterized protein n=1 Tax=Phanerochaete sordida TaxID=48140 RepID=A0A9P3G4H0_9APHY|nr:hypothetical protein PsYK624_041990 [Phanerochaete sordida]